MARHVASAGFRLLTLVLLGVLLCGFSEEARTWQGYVEGFFQAGAAGDDCSAIEAALEGWMKENADDAVAATSQLVKQIDKIETKDGLSQADLWKEALYSEIAGTDGFNALFQCTEQSARIGSLIEDFDATIASPVSMAIDQARIRLAQETSKERDARMKVAELALSTAERTAKRYIEVTEYYQDRDCKTLARNLDQWHSSYYRLIDQPVQDFTSEVAHMSNTQFEKLKPRIDTVLAVQKATHRAVECLDELDGSSRETLNNQTSLLLLTIDNLKRATPRR